MTTKHYRRYKTAFSSNRKPIKCNVERYDPITETWKVIKWGLSEEAACAIAHRGCSGHSPMYPMYMAIWDGSKRG